MAQTNIYDFIIAELIKNGSNGSSGLDLTVLSLTVNNPSVIAGETVNGVIFTSTLSNLPSGWTIVADSHVISVPGFADTTGSITPVLTTGLSINLPLPNDILVATSTIDVTDGTDTVTLTATANVIAYSYIFYGVKAYSATPVTAGLDSVIGSDISFTITDTTGVGRLIFVIDNDVTQPISIVDQHGNEWVIAEDFETYSNLFYTFYTLNWDTQFSGTEDKTFTFKYA